MNLALFDFDGTITTRETFADFIRAVAPWRYLFGKLFLAPMLIGYKLGLVAPKTMRANIVQLGLRGLSEEQVREIGTTFARDVLPDLIRPTALELIQWHQAQGDTVVVVSAGLDLYLAEWCRQHRLELICSRLESRDGVLTGHYVESDCCGKEKSRRVLERYDVARYPTVYAYGDTQEDLDLLSLADRKYYCWEEIS